MPGTSASGSSVTSSMRAPALRSVAMVRVNAPATVGSSASSIVWVGTARRSASIGRAASKTVRSASTSCSSTASRTDSVIAQAVSSVVESGTAPAVGVSRAVFLNPTRPCSAAGMRIEPPVSEPSAAHAAPPATDTPPPEVEPPGMRGSASSKLVAAFDGVPWCGLMPTPENANSDMLVRASSAAPARRRRATAGLSTTAAGRLVSTFEPAVVTWPCTSNKSFTVTASPASAGKGAPVARSESTAAALAAAAAKCLPTNACCRAGAFAAATDFASAVLALRAPCSIWVRVPVRSGLMVSAIIERLDWVRRTWQVTREPAI